MKMNETNEYGQFINIERNHYFYSNNVNDHIINIKKLQSPTTLLRNVSGSLHHYDNEEEYYNIHNGQLEPNLGKSDKYNLSIYIHAIGLFVLCIILIKMYFN